MDLNPMALGYIFEDTLFHFTNDGFISVKNNAYFGDNHSNITIVSKKHFQKEDFDLFVKILAALKLSLDDVALVCKKPEVGFHELIRSLDPKKVILFGINPFEIGFKDAVANTYEIIEVGTIQLLQAEDFSVYHLDASKKKALWLNLQKLLA